MRLNPWKLSTFVLAAALAASLSIHWISDAAAGASSQPQMKAALAATQSAQRSLKKAVANKTEHRAAALEHLAAAELEIKEGLASAPR
ncbi:MAG TPA: hypothetical protein VML75_05640 [Kofleriaceae bacterium]|nr:hypothetical protein [Kofleriaceae bacterium]